MSLLTGNADLGYTRTFQNSGPPRSGTAGTFFGQAEFGDIMIDVTNGAIYINESSVLASPYWTPLSYDQPALWGFHDDFRSQVGVAVAGSAASVALATGLRVFGQGAAENDSGLVIQTAGEGGVTARMTTTNEAAHLLALGMDAGVMQPDQHLLLVVDVELTNVTAITDRALFVGFLGTAADALDPAVTGATTVATLVQDDLAGLHMDSGYTDADRLYGVHNKSNEAATQDLTADGDTSTDLAAAATYQRFRVEITAAGVMTAFVDKVQVYTHATALDADEEVTPVCYLESNAAAIKSADIRRMAAWAYR